MPFEDWKKGNGAGVLAFESTKTPRKFSSDFIETARATQKNGTDQIYWIRLRILDLTDLPPSETTLAPSTQKDNGWPKSFRSLGPVTERTTFMAKEADANWL